MSSTYPVELESAFRSLADVVYADESPERVYDTICRNAVAAVAGCDHASVMLRVGARVYTAGFSDPMAEHCDRIELELGEGPCIDAIDEDEPDQFLCPDLTTASRWPGLSARLLAETAIRGMGGFRIRMEGRKVGALNVFSNDAGALDAESMSQASVLAAFVSVAVTALDRGSQSLTLRRGLESNREIGKAMGLLMATHGVSEEQAFEMLSTLSQEMNVKLAQLAADVVADHGQRSTPGTSAAV